MCRVPRLSDQRLRFFALTVEFYAYDDQLPSPPRSGWGARGGSDRRTRPPARNTVMQAAVCMQIE